MPLPDDIRAQLDALPDSPATPSAQKSGEVGPAAGGVAAEQPGVPTDAGAVAAGRALDALPDGQDPTVGMRAAAAASQGHTPAEAAQAAAMARRAGVQPRALLGDAGRVAAHPAFDAAHYDDIAARHPELAQWLSEPTHAALARGDVAALRAVSTAAQGLAQPAIPDVPTDPLPVLGAFKFGVLRAADSLNKNLLAGPAWIQQESRSLLGITSDPTWGTPLAIFQESVDQDRAMERIRATYAPSAMRDLVGTTAGILADPTAALLLPAEGASLAIKGSQVLGEAAQAAVAIKAAATVQAAVAGGQTAINATERARDNGGGPGRALADAANLATQASLAYFFGRAGQEIPVLRGIGQTPFTAAPLRELGSDIVRNAVTGGTQSVAQGTAESLFAGQGLPDAGALVALYASGAIPGALIAGGSLHEAVLAQHHLTTLRHAETLQFANKMADTIAAVQASKAAQASPEEVGHLLDAIADRAASQGGMSHVYLQADDWQAHFQAKGEDPVAAAHQAGLGEEYARAKGLGGDMQVPLRVAIGLGADSDNPAALVARMRPAANAPTAGEAARFFQEGPDDLAKAKTFAAAQIDAARGAGDPEGQTIYEERKAQLVAAGVETRQAEDAARLHQRFFQRMAERFNEEQAKIGGKAVTATDLADQFALRVQKALPDVIENIIASGRLDRVLDTLRTAGPADAELLAARASFRTMGIDPLTQTNEQVADALRAQGTVGAPTLGAKEPAATEHVAKERPAAPEGERGPAYEQAKSGDHVRRGTFQPPRLPGGKSLIQLLGDANESTVFHESAHYFLEVMGHLADRPDAPQSIKDDFQTIMTWSGYGDRAGMVQRSAELAKLQAEVAGRDATPEERARLKELAAPHEAFARGFERYLMEGVAPAKGLRKAFERIKAWMVSVYKDARNLGAEINPAVRDVFDRLLASDREVAAARRRVSDEPAFRSIDETKMTPEQWGRYQELVGATHQAESEALEHELMTVHREVASEAYANERKAVSVQVADQVAQERVHDAIRQLQDGETWDGRPIAEPMKIAKADVERLLTPEEMLRLPGPKRERNAGRVIYTPEAHGLPADEVAQRLGYATGHELLQDIIAAPDRQARVDELTDAEMKRRHPDPMDHQASMDHVADRALHASDIRANLMEVEKHHLAVLAQEQAKADAAAATSDAVDAERRKMQGQLDTLKARIAAKEADANDEAEAARLAAALTKGVARQSLTALRDERQTMRVAAGEMIADTKLSAFDPDRFVAAERKAAIAFGEAMAKKDYEKAIAQKRAQMMNAELARAAYAAQEQAGKDVKALGRSSTDTTYRATIGKAGGWEWTVTFPDGTTKVFDQPDGAGKSSQEQARAAAIEGKGTYERTSGYLDQVDALLEGFEFKDVSPREARRRASLAAFLEKVRFVTLPSGERVPTGESPDIPQSLIEKAGRTSYKDMTVSELHDLRRAVESIETMAKLKNKLLLSTGKAERDAVVAECIAQLTKTATGAKRPKIVAKPSRWPAFDTLRKMTSTFFDELRMVPSLVHEMDHFKEGGPLYRAFVEPAQRAADAELEMKAEGRARFAEAIQEWGKKDDLLRTAVPGIERSFTRLERVVVLMHYGNKEGRQRLLDLHEWNDAKVHAIVDSLDAKDIALANRLVDLLSSHWSDVKAMEERYHGIAPPKVEAIPVELPNGSYVGGYQRIYYDGESATTLEHMAQQAAEDGLTGAGIRRSAKTPAGYTKERVETVKERTLSLAPGNWARAYNEMAHDLTHRDLVMNQMKLLRSKPMKDALVDHWGTGVYQQFVHQTMGLAQGNKPATTSLEKVAEYLRVTSNYSRRAFNPAYALIQEAGLPLARTRVGDRYLAAAALQLYSGPLGLDHTAHWIAEQSTAMRYRLRTRDANFGDALSETTLSGSARKFMDGAGMFMVMKTWEHLDNVCWKGAYDQHMEQSGGDHTESVHVADQIVESVMGSAKQKDLAQIQRIGGPLGKVFTSNMNWALANWGQIAVAWNQTGGGLRALGSGGFRQMAHGLGALATLCIVGPMLWDWMYDEMKGEDMKAWTTGKGLATKVVSAPVYAAMSSVPILRDLAPAVIDGRNQQGGTTGLNWLKALQAAASALHARHYREGTAKAVVAGAATFLPLPTSALFQAIDGHAYAARHHAGFVETAWRMLNGAPLGKK